jgi:hypothetical protein
VAKAERRYQESGGRGNWAQWCSGYIHGFLEQEKPMGEYERLQEMKKAIIAEEKQRDARSVIAQLIPYLHHDYLCAAHDVKDGGCTCGLYALLWELQTGEKAGE